MEKLNSDSFNEKISLSDNKVAVSFTAPWCGFCKTLKLMLENIENEWGAVEMFYVDTDEEKELAKEYSVSSVPMLFIFSEGKVLKKSVGLMKKSELYEMLEINTDYK